MLSSLTEGEEDKLFFNAPLTGCNPGFLQPSGTRCRDGEGRGSAQVGRRWHGVIMMGEMGTERALCPPIWQQGKPPGFLAFWESKKKLKAGQDDGKEREAARQGEALKWASFAWSKKTWDMEEVSVRAGCIRGWVLSWTPVPAAPEQLSLSAALGINGRILHLGQVMQFWGSLMGSLMGVWTALESLWR